MAAQRGAWTRSSDALVLVLSVRQLVGRSALCSTVGCTLLFQKLVVIILPMLGSLCGR